MWLMFPNMITPKFRRSFKFNWKNSADPRLKKICGIMDEVKEVPKEKKVERVSFVPQSDPRKRKIQEVAAAAGGTSACKENFKLQRYYRTHSTTRT